MSAMTILSEWPLHNRHVHGHHNIPLGTVLSDMAKRLDFVILVKRTTPQWTSPGRWSPHEWSFVSPQLEAAFDDYVSAGTLEQFTSWVCSKISEDLERQVVMFINAYDDFVVVAGNGVVEFCGNIYYLYTNASRVYESDQCRRLVIDHDGRMLSPLSRYGM